MSAVIFSFATLGLFNMYFYFKNFHVQSESKEFDAVNLIKGMLYPLFSLEILKEAESSNQNYKGVSAKVIFVAQLIFVFGASVMIGPLKVIGFFTFIPLLAANRLFKSANEANDVQEYVAQFKPLHYLIGFVGCVLVAYLMSKFI